MAFAALAAACGGSPGGASPGTPLGEAGEAGAADIVGTGGTAGKPKPSTGGVAGITDCDQRATESAALNESIFHGGFEVALGTAVLTPATASCAPGDLAIDGTFHNRGSDAFAFDSDMLVSSGGKDYPLSASSDIPQVPGGRSGKGTLHFAVDTDFVLSSATLVVGSAFEHDALVPLGPKSTDAFTSLEPADSPLLGKFTAGTLEFNMTGGYIRADQPWDHTTLDKKHYNITFVFSVKYTGGTLGGASILSDNFDLVLPDGTAVATNDGPSEVLDNAGTTLDNLDMTFTVPGPMEGKFALEASGQWGDGTAAASISMPFVVPHIEAFGK